MSDGLDSFEDVLLTLIVEAVHKKFPGLAVLGETVLEPPVLPCLCVEVIDSSTYEKSLDSSGRENHSLYTVEINTFSNRTDGKRLECREIFDAANAFLRSKGFIRKNKKPIGLDDSTKHRLFGRYSGVVSRDMMVYRK